MAKSGENNNINNYFVIYHYISFPYTPLPLSLLPHTPFFSFIYFTLYQDIRSYKGQEKIEEIPNQWSLLAIVKHSLSLLTQFIQRWTMLLLVQIHVVKIVSVDFLLVCQGNIGLTSQLLGYFHKET